MVFSQEIKNFTKNTLILTFLFAVVLHFSWGYVLTFFTASADTQNDQKFERANITYLGNIATALSLNLGNKTSTLSSNNTGLESNAISISEVMHNPSMGQSTLIATNMTAINAYVAIIQKDIKEELDHSYNKASTLDRHISLLQSYYIRTNERLVIIRDQKNDLKNLLEQATAEEKAAKQILQSSYNTMDYTGIDAAIEQYVRAKNTSSRVRIYAIYLDRFERSYQALQAKNTKILDALTNNRTPLLQGATVVIPDSGSDIIKELGLIQSEAEYKASQLLE